MLRYSKERLEDERSISAIYSKAEKELEARKALYEIYRRKLTDEEISSLTDEDIKVPLERYIAIMSAGYFGGKAPVYKVKAYNEERAKIITELFDMEPNTEQDVKEIEELISHIIDYNDDGSLFYDLVFDFLVKRACYELYYKDENTGEITIARSDALETVAIWDYSLPKKLIGIYRIIKTVMANNEYQTMVELTTANGKRYYYDTPEKRKLFGTKEYETKFGDEPLFKEAPNERQPKLWDDDIPATAIEQEDGLAIFEPVISLIKAYEQVIQNSRNTFKYNDEAILAMKNYQADNPMIIQDEDGNFITNPAREKEDEQVLKSKVIYLGDQGDVNWVEKNVNDSALQNHKKTLMDIICLTSFCPNMTDLGFTSADNSAALEKKFFSLQQYIATFKGDFEKALIRRWRIILNKFNKEKGRHFDFRDVEVELIPNMPTDEATRTDIALKLRGLLSDKTVIDLLPMHLDAQNEIDKMDKQNQENIEKNLENMSLMGQDMQNAELNVEQNNSEQNSEQNSEISQAQQNIEKEQDDKKMTEKQEVKADIKQDNVKQSDTITK